MTLTRQGSVNSQMIFEEDGSTPPSMRPLQGELTVDIQTSRLRHNLQLSGAA